MVENDEHASSSKMNEYTSVGCNRTCNCLAASKSTGLVYYGANNAVAVYSPKEEKILQTLVQHSNRVNCVTVLELDSRTSLLCAGASSGQISTWTVDHSILIHTPFASRSQCHESSVTCLSAVSCDGDTLLASTANDSRIKLWKLDKDAEEKLSLLHDLDLKTGLSFSVHLVAWPKNCITLFYALDNCTISVASFDKQKGELNHLNTLRGHEDWVTHLDSIMLTDTTMLLASASQDSMVRLWKLEPPAAATQQQATDTGLEVKDLLLQYNDQVVYRVVLESVLCGHEDKVNAVQWRRSENNNQLSLLTASLDKTMIVWEEEEDGIWTERARFGEIGGNTLGIFGAIWGPEGNVLGYSFSGAFHSWVPSQQQGEESSGEMTWKSGTVVGGHQGAVCDLSWDVQGRYLLSVGVDQTTRCHSICKASGKWHEVARPQVHGYDMSCVSSLPNLTFVSGAEEKVIRAFRAPQNFLDNFTRLTGHSLVEVDLKSLPQGASLPTLGLSNKAVYEGEINKQVLEQERHVKDQFPDFYFSPEVLDKPPTEESLVQNTLWPEVHKMYGHGYEVYCLTSSHDGRMVASACKSSQPREAAILIWDTATWKEIGRIEVHSLTVTQLEFSPVNNLLLSVSRDRTLALHNLELKETNSLVISRVKYLDKKTSPHKRVIWSCSWSHDGQYFYTASRDKIVCCWTSSGEPVTSTPLTLPESVTAVAGSSGNPFSSSGQPDCYLVALGLESGEIQVVKHDRQGSFSTLATFNMEEAHHAAVKRLQFSLGDPCVLASCGQDHLVKIYNLASLVNS